MKKIFLIVLLCVISVLMFQFLGCGGDSDSSDTQTTEDISGTWTVTDPLTGASATLTISQDGNYISGTLQGPINTYTVEGTVNGNTVDFTASGPIVSVHITATVEGNTMSGSFSTSNGLSGSWSATYV